MKKLIICAVVAALVAGCTSGRTLTPAQSAYLERVNDTPLLFTIPPAMQPQAWARALDFLSRFSHLRLRVSGETRIETENPGEYQGEVGYIISQRRVEDSIQVRIAVKHVPDYVASRAERAGEQLVVPTNARILALYMITGELMPELVDQ